jgi:hypothetical protein
VKDVLPDPENGDSPAMWVAIIAAGVGLIAFIYLVARALLFLSILFGWGRS